VEQAAQRANAPRERRKIPLLRSDDLDRQQHGRKAQAIGSSRHDDTVVRYAVRSFDRRTSRWRYTPRRSTRPTCSQAICFTPKTTNDIPVTRTVVCTSATLATGGHFHHYKARCGIKATGEERVLPDGLRLSTQALLYQPPLPAYDYRNASVFYDAVASEIERLLEVSRGRTLCLFTSWSGLQQVNDRLQAEGAGVIWPARPGRRPARRAAELVQGDALQRAARHALLLGGRGHSRRRPEPGVLDKMPFPTPATRCTARACAPSRARTAAAASTSTWRR
jgi:ATP-dependent DNA helicase DinG